MLLTFIKDAKLTMNSCGNIPVVSQNVSGFPSMIFSGGKLGSEEEARLTDVPAELSPMSNMAFQFYKEKD